MTNRIKNSLRIIKNLGMPLWDLVKFIPLTTLKGFMKIIKSRKFWMAFLYLSWLLTSMFLLVLGLIFQHELLLVFFIEMFLGFCFLAGYYD